MNTAALTKQLILHEGLRLFPYRDAVGKLTIGVGRNLTDRGLSKDEAYYLLQNDVADCVADCRSFPWFDGLNDVRQRVIVDLRFNLGPKGLRTFKNTLALIARGEYAKAAANMLKSKWALQVGQRAMRLAKMMETGTEA